MHAREIYQYVQTACGESAHEIVEEWKHNGQSYDPDVDAILNNFKKRGVRDIAGAYGDHQFNDVNTLKDLIGDKVYDAASDKDGRIGVLDELFMIGSFPAWRTAISELKEEFKK